MSHIKWLIWYHSYNMTHMIWVRKFQKIRIPHLGFFCMNMLKNCRWWILLFKFNQSETSSYQPMRDQVPVSQWETSKFMIPHLEFFHSYMLKNCRWWISNFKIDQWENSIYWDWSSVTQPIRERDLNQWESLIFASKLTPYNFLMILIHWRIAGDLFRSQKHVKIFIYSLTHGTFNSNFILFYQSNERITTCCSATCREGVSGCKFFSPKLESGPVSRLSVR